MNRIKFIRNRMQLSRKAMHSLYQIPASSIERWEKGQIPSVNNCQLLIAAAKEHGIEVDINWLRSQQGPEPIIKQENQPEIITSIINRLQKTKHRFKSFLVEDDSMIPIYKPGDWLIVQGLAHTDFCNYENQPCLILTEHGSYLRILKSAASPNFYDLVVANNLGNAKCFYQERVLAAHAIIFHLIA